MGELDAGQVALRIGSSTLWCYCTRYVSIDIWPTPPLYSSVIRVAARQAISWSESRTSYHGDWVPRQRSGSWPQSGEVSQLRRHLYSICQICNEACYSIMRSPLGFWNIYWYLWFEFWQELPIGTLVRRPLLSEQGQIRIRTRVVGKMSKKFRNSFSDKSRCRTSDMLSFLWCELVNFNTVNYPWSRDVIDFWSNESNKPI